MRSRLGLECKIILCQLREPRLFFPLLQVFPSTVKVLELGPPYYDELEVVAEPVEDNFRGISIPSIPTSILTPSTALSRYTSLEVLKLTTQLPLHDTDADWFLDALSHVQAPELRELRLEYRREPYKTSIGHAHWKALDEVLSGWPGSHFRRVSVKIDPGFFPDATYGAIQGEDSLEQTVLALFTKSTKRGLEVVIDFSAPWWYVRSLLDHNSCLGADWQYKAGGNAGPRIPIGECRRQIFCRGDLADGARLGVRLPRVPAHARHEGSAVCVPRAASQRDRKGSARETIQARSIQSIHVDGCLGSAYTTPVSNGDPAALGMRIPTDRLDDAAAGQMNSSDPALLAD